MRFSKRALGRCARALGTFVDEPYFVAGEGGGPLQSRKAHPVPRAVRPAKRMLAGGAGFWLTRFRR